MPRFGWRLILLTDGHFDIFRPIGLGLIFNNMLEHLLRGQFDVDPQVIGIEAFIRDGRTYTYFGIFPALLRLPLVAASRLHDVDMTVASVWVAASLSWLFRLLAIRLILSHAPEKAISTFLAAVLVVAFALQGESIQFLRPSIFQETIQWAAALASLFVFLVVRLVTQGGSSGFVVSPLVAAVAGLALLARVSTGLGLYTAIGLILVVDVTKGNSNARTTDHAGRWWLSSFWQRTVSVVCSPRFVTVSLILIFFVLCVGIVNYGRWGNALTFADLHSYKIALEESSLDRLSRLERYGEFNFVRLPWGAQYYFLPLWVLPVHDGGYLFEAAQRRLVDAAELPPGTFVLSDPVVIILGIAFVYLAARDGRRTDLDMPYSLAAMTGLAVPALLMLIAISTTFRYRMEFYPLFNLAAFLGLLLIVRDRALQRHAWLNAFIVSAIILGIVVAHLSLALYKVSPVGPAWNLDLSQGWSGLLARQVMTTYPSRGWLFSGSTH